MADRGKGVSLEPLLHHRRWILGAFLVATVLAAPGLRHLRLDNGADGFIVQDDEALERFRILERSFGRDRAVRVVVRGEGLWTSDGLTWLGELERRADDPGGVYGAAGPVLHHRWHLESWPPEDPERFRDRIRSDLVDRNAGWVSEDGSTVTILAGLFKMSPERRRSTLEALEEGLRDRPPGVSADLTGLAVADRALTGSLKAMAALSFPLLLLTSAGLLLLIFRDLTGVVTPLLLVAVCETVLAGAMGYAGQRLDVVTIIVLPLVFVIALATGVHVLAHHRRLDTGEMEETGRAVETYRTKAWAVLWTGLTTCAGFGSLSVSGVPAVRSLGLWAAFGISFLTLAALSFYPALLATLGAGSGPGSERGLEARLAEWGAAAASMAMGRRRMVWAVVLLVALLALVGLPRLRVETGVLTFFPPDHPLRERVQELQAEGIGVVSASLVFPEGELDDEETLRRSVDLAATLREHPAILGVLGPGDLAENVARLAERGVPGARPRNLTEALDFMEDHPELSLLLRMVSTRSRDRVRLILSTPMADHARLAPLYREAEELARKTFPDREIWVTGQYPLILEAQRTLLRTMIGSFGITFLVIAGFLRYLLGSNTLTLRVLVPNLWPVLVVVGGMAWTGIPVDSATVMVASVALALAVDDSLHTVAHLRRLIPDRSRTHRDAVVESLRQTAPGHVTTSVILTLGFGVCALSELTPIAHFGVLASVGVLAALTADLWILPALLSTADRRSLALLGLTDQEE